MGTIGLITVPAEPQARARALAEGTAARLGTALSTYEALFTGAGLDLSEVERMARSSRAALIDWAPDLAAEIDAYADASGVAAWRIHALNARTEILAAGAKQGRGSVQRSPTPAATTCWRHRRGTGTSN